MVQVYPGVVMCTFGDMHKEIQVDSGLALSQKNARGTWFRVVQWFPGYPDQKKFECPYTGYMVHGVTGGRYHGGKYNFT